jgi:hypothetical protein
VTTPGSASGWYDAISSTASAILIVVIVPGSVVARCVQTATRHSRDTLSIGRRSGMIETPPFGVESRNDLRNRLQSAVTVRVDFKSGGTCGIYVRLDFIAHSLRNIKCMR